MGSDAADGSPAMVKYSEEGTITDGFSSVRGLLSALETIKMNEDALLYRAAVVMRNSDKAVLPSGVPLAKKED